MPVTWKDYSGERFGKWTVVSRDFRKKRPTYYLCKCECGTESSISLCNLTRGLTSKCMICQAKSRSSHLIGTKHYFLTILDNPKIDGKVKFLCRCDCGNDHIISRIVNGHKSCGKCDLVRKSQQKRAFISGKKYGKLTVISKKDNKNILCLCECGNKIEIPYYKLKVNMPSCGCYWKNKHIEKSKKLEGTKFFYLKVIKFLKMGEDKRAVYLVKCKCGNKFEQSISYLFGSKSCGCLKKETAPKGSQNYLSKLTEVEVISIRELFSSGYYNRKELSQMFNITYEHACNLISKRTWKHV